MKEKELKELKLTKNIIIPFPNFQQNTIISPTQMNDNFEEIEHAYNALIDNHNGAITKINEVENELVKKTDEKIDEVDDVVANIKSDYESLERIIIDENVSVNLQNQINQTNSQLEHIQNEKINNIINVKNGYKNIKKLMCDGSNEYDRIQAFLDIAKTNGKVTLYFPEGEYCFGGNALRIHKNTTIIMSKNATIKRLGTHNVMFLNGEQYNSNYANGYDGDGNIHIYGGVFDLNNSVMTSESNISCFNFAHGENITFNQVTIKNGQNGHYMQIASCKNVFISNCIFKNQTHVGASTTFETIQIETATSSSFPYFGGYDDTPSININIDSCKFENIIRGVGTHSKTGMTNKCKNIRITNCTFSDVVNNCCEIYYYDNVVISNNVFENINNQPIAIRYSTYVNVIGNIVNNTLGSFLWSIESSYVIINSNNIVDPCMGTPSYAIIRLTTCSNFTIDSNVCKGDSYENVVFTSDGCTNINFGKNNDIQSGSNTYIGGEFDYADSHTTLLFKGDLSNANASATLSDDIRRYSYLIVQGNDNSSETAQMCSTIIPLVTISTVSQSRYRIVVDDTTNTMDRVDFSFPDYSSVRVDSISGTSHLRRVIGVK